MAEDSSISKGPASSRLGGANSMGASAGGVRLFSPASYSRMISAIIFDAGAVHCSSYSLSKYIRASGGRPNRLLNESSALLYDSAALIQRLRALSSL